MLKLKSNLKKKIYIYIQLGNVPDAKDMDTLKSTATDNTDV